eukprot:8724450-Alexandrium_andersonii.AAC.1
MPAPDWPRARETLRACALTTASASAARHPARRKVDPAPPPRPARAATPSTSKSSRKPWLSRPKDSTEAGRTRPW